MAVHIVLTHVFGHLLDTKRVAEDIAVAKSRRSKIDTPSARASLPISKKPIWKSLEPGVFVGYRRGRVERRWVGRVYLEAERKYVVEAVGHADDADLATNQRTMTYAQARDAVIAFARRKRSRAVSVNAADTVSSVIKSYIAVRDARETMKRGHPVKSDAHRLTKHVLCHGDLAALAIDDLTATRLCRWRAELGGAVATRRRTANDFRAALLASKPTEAVRLAIRDGLAMPDAEIEEAEPEARANQILSDEEVRRLIAASQEADETGDLYRMVLVMAATGARFSQLRRLRVMDLQQQQSRLMIPGSFKGRKRATAKPPYPVPVGADIVAALVPVIKGRNPSEPLLERWRHVQIGRDAKTGRPIWARGVRGTWTSASELSRPFAQIAKNANLPHVIPYAFRHSSIVRGIRVGLPIRLVAAAHDTSVAMIERHYGRWVTEGLEELTRKAIVQLAPAVSDNVVPQSGCSA